MSNMAIQGQRSRLSDTDIQNIKQEYRDTLQELDFNSRPHIMNLTELAHNYSKICPQVIVKLIEDRIKYVSQTFQPQNCEVLNFFTGFKLSITMNKSNGISNSFLKTTFKFRLTPTT